MLTGLEERLLQFITRHISQYGHSPTLTEIGEALNIRSKGTIHRYVDSLIKKGHLHRDGRSWRGLRLTGEQHKRLIVLPFAGRIAAGKPIEAIPEQLEINFSDMLMGTDRYALEVKGDSMIEAGIFDGDYVVIRQTETANNGDIVVALIDNGEATLKKLRKHGDRVELIPANKALAPMIYPADRVFIQGVVVGQVRSYR
ncbi:MAG: transcriptional repressor LexA [Pseudomonadota bacterium]